MADAKSMKKERDTVEEEFEKLTVEATNLSDQLKQNTSQVNGRLNQISVRKAQLQGQFQLLDSMIKAEKPKKGSKKPDLKPVN